MKKFIGLLLGVLLVVQPITAMADTEAADEIKVYVKGELLTLDQAPYIVNDSTMVPMRAIFEALDATVDYDGDTKTVTANKNAIEVKLSIGSDKAYVNNEETTLLAAAEIKNDRTMVPLRFVSEALGAQVTWIAETKTIDINDGVIDVVANNAKEGYIDWTPLSELKNQEDLETNNPNAYNDIVNNENINEEKSAYAIIDDAIAYLICENDEYKLYIQYYTMGSVVNSPIEELVTKGNQVEIIRALVFDN